jgi:16S rRNA (cytidine1402-2'-O)-methyltransferase
MPGTLFLVGTPIGNLSDLSKRAVETLQLVDFIACEDTRQTAKLLASCGISKPMRSYHEHNEAARAVEFAAELAAGRRIALVSDGGMPLLSDPGYRLVRAAIEAGAAVVPVPGANAAVSALAASGLPTDSYYFGGFLPAKGGARRAALEAARTIPATLIFYEAPHRLLESLEDAREVLGDRQCAVARELTKVHEEIVRGRISEVAADFASRPAIKGEITVVIDRTAPLEEGGAADLAAEVAEREAGGESRMEAIKAVAKRRGIGKREVYRALNP